MPISSILFGLALAILVVPFIAGPFVKDGRRRQKPPDERSRPAPELSKRDALVALRDLDFDFRTGKVAEEDYVPLRQRLLIQAAEAVQAVEAEPPAVDDEIEAAVRALRGSPRTGRRLACPQCHAPVGDDDRFCPKCGTALGIALRPEAQGAACPQCHNIVQVTDKFCARCGAILKAEVVAVS
jgi:RNA polymerase subunit RPABC4/transcription elongation factor Spt4